MVAGRCKATWKREFKLPWREARPPNFPPFTHVDGRRRRIPRKEKAAPTEKRRILRAPRKVVGGLFLRGLFARGPFVRGFFAKGLSGRGLIVRGLFVGGLFVGAIQSLRPALSRKVGGVSFVRGLFVRGLFVGGLFVSVFFVSGLFIMWVHLPLPSGVWGAPRLVGRSFRW